MEEEAKPIRQQQRRMNQTILDVVKKEVTKLLVTWIIYLISDSQWVSLVQVLPKKSRMIVMKNQHDELVLMQIQNSWRVCIDYRRLNQATCKDHFPLPFIDQVLEKLARKSHYYFLDGFSIYMQIHIAPEDQHNTTFTFPFGTFAYTRIPFALNWELSFELMYDASNSALGAVLGERPGVGKPMHKLEAKSRLIQWMLLLQEFNIEIRDKKSAKNSPLRIQHRNQRRIRRRATTAHQHDYTMFPPEASWIYKERLQSGVKYYIWDDPYLWRPYNDQVIRRCIPDGEITSILQFCHVAPGGGHYGSTRMTRKVIDYRFYWPTIFRDAYQFVSTCEKCQNARVTISRRHEMPQQPILFYEVFDVWGINFMGPFPVSNGYSNILLVTDYISRWEEAIATDVT
ncbi:putative mitochondrial protein, partial [Mucuna pruriens]